MCVRKKRGWGHLARRRKRHYFIGSWSICGKVIGFSGRVYQRGNDHPDNCLKCMKELEGGNW